MKYKEWLYEWLEIYEKPSVKKRTYDQYADIVNRRLVPVLGEYELKDLTAAVLQRYIAILYQSGNTKTGKGLSSNSVNSIILVIHSSLSMAHTLGFTDEFHVDKLKRPRIREKPVECFTLQEQKLIERAVLCDKRDKMFGIVLCLYTGLRIGELLSLEWVDIDLKNSELSVTKTCYEGKDENGNWQRIVSTPKTERSRRIVPVPKQLLPYLKELKKRSRSKYVVGRGDSFVSVRSYQRSFELLLKKLKIPHHGFHSLRHTFATRALECGMDVKSLSEILGHNDPSVTLKRYAHSFMAHKKEYMNRLGKLL